MEGIVGSAPVMNWQANDLAAAWQEFIDHVTFVFEGPLNDKTEAQKCNYLMLWVGTKGREIYKTFTMTEEQKKVLDQYYRRFKEYVIPKTNLIFSRYKFQSRVQTDETFECFVTDLKLIARDCGYHDCDEMIRDRIVFGIRSPKIREKLFNVGSDLTLQKAIEIAQAYELSQSQLKAMNPSQDTEVHSVAHRQYVTSSKPMIGNLATSVPQKERSVQNVINSITSRTSVDQLSRWKRKGNFPPEKRKCITSRKKKMKKMTTSS